MIPGGSVTTKPEPLTLPSFHWGTENCGPVCAAAANVSSTVTNVVARNFRVNRIKFRPQAKRILILPGSRATVAHRKDDVRGPKTH
jgi:hypothetical protein